jgi:hypothetical protein
MKRLWFSILACLTLAAAMSVGSLAQESNPIPLTPRFEAIGVYIDPHGKPLATYQCELTLDQPDCTLVGIQGGDHPAFSQPPYYDPHALMANRIILAALSTDSDLPTGKTRVATLMVRVSGTLEPKYVARLQVAASADARPMDAEITTSGVNP